MKVLILSRKEIEGIASMKEVIGVMEGAFKAKGLGKVQMPPKIYVSFEGGISEQCPAMCQSLDWGELKS